MANKEVESRIVEMQFDGSDFDKGIRKSQKNLEDFKKSLNFEDAAKQMETLTEAGSFGQAFVGMANNIKKLTKEFAGIGELSTYIAKKVKSAWEGALNSVERFVKSLTTDQITEGSKKYEGLLRSVQTIVNATGDAEEFVYQVMQDLYEYTDQTSYNFADMANNISKFTTAGVDLKDAELEMEGIANWAALAGQGVNEAQRAMYNISQAMSAGYMLKIDYKSIQNANMDIREFRQQALDAAVAAGTLKKETNGIYKTVKGGKEVNIDNFTETLQFKWFDRKTMETVFKTFGDGTTDIGKKAYAAAQRCVTFTDVLNAWKDMLSTGWMKSYEYVFGQLSDAMALFSGLCDKVSNSLSALVELRNGILERWNIGGGRNSLWGALFGELETPDGETLFKDAYGLLDLMQSIGDAIYDAFWDFVGRFINPENKDLFDADREGYGMNFLAAGLTTLTKKFQEFTNKIEDFLFKADPGETTTRFDRLRHVAETIYAVITLVVDVIRGIGQFAGEIIGQLYPAIHAVELLIDMLLQMFTGTVANGVKKNTIGNFFHRLAELLRPVTTVINIVVQALAALIAKVVVMLQQSGLINMIGDALKYVSDVVMLLIAKLVNSGVIQQIFSWITTAISKIPALVQKIRTLAAAFFDMARNSKALKGIKGFFTNLFGGKSVKDVLNSLKKNIVNIIKKVPEIFTSIKTSGIWNSISGFFGTIISKIFGITDAKVEGNTKITEQISEAIAKPIEDLGKGDIIKNAVDKAKPGFLANLKQKISEIWNSIADFFTTLANSEAIAKIKSFFSGTTFMGLLSGAKDIIKWLAIFRNGSGLVSMGKGIKSLGKGVKIFGKNLKNLNLSNIFSNIFNISNIINSNNTDNSKRSSVNFSKFGAQLLMIAAGIALVVQAGSHLAKMKPDELYQAGLSLAAIIGGLVIAGFAAKKLAGNGGSLFALAAAVLVLFIPLNIVQKMQWNVLMDGVLKLCGIVLLLSTGLAIAGNTKVKGFVSLAAALTLILIPLKALMNMPLGDLKNGGGLVQGILALEALILTMALAARLTGGNKLKGMISLSASLILLMIPLKIIAAMDWDDIARAVVMLGLIMAGIILLVRLTNGAKASKLAGIVAALTALSAIGWLVGHTMNWQQALVGFGPIVLMIGLMGFMLKEAAKLTPEQMKHLKSIFTAFTITVAVIAAAIAILTVLDVKWETVLGFFGGIIATLAVVGIMLKLAATTDPSGIGKVALVLGLLSVLVAVIGGSLILLGNYNIDWSVILSFMGGIAALVAVLGLVLPVLANISVKGAVVGALSLAAAVIAIMGALSLMMPVLMGSVGSALSEMSAKLKTVSGLLKDFIDRMDSISDDKVQHVKRLVGDLYDVISQFSGLKDLAADIRTISMQLMYLGTGIELLFVNESKCPDPDESRTFAILSKLFEMAPSFSAFDIGTLPSQLMYLGVGLMLFNESVKEISDTDPPALGLLQGIFGQADNIKKFSELPLDTFREQMSGLGGAMSLYAKGAKEVTGLDTETGETLDISKSIGILKAVCNALSGEDGSGEFKLPENMPDSASLGLFAGQLESLGNALSTFATAAKSMETDTTNASALLSFLAEVGGYITPENLDVVNAFDTIGHADESGTGGKLGQFALDIGALGTALSTFASNVGGKSTEFNTGLGVLSKLQTLNERLTGSSLAFTKAFDSAGVHATALGTFATDIGALGRALASFAQNVVMEDGTQADFDYALRSLNFLATLQNRLPKIGGLHGLIHGNVESIGALATDLQEMGVALRDFSDKMVGSEEDGTFNLEAVNGALEFLADLIEIVGILNTKVVGTDDQWASDYGDVIENFAGLLSLLNSSEFTANNPFIHLDGSLFDALAETAFKISESFNKIGGIDAIALESFKNVASGIVAIVSMNPSGEFTYPGEMIAAGIMEGIYKGESGVIQAAIDVVQAAIDAANETADSHSPSRVFEQLGEFMDAGLVQGLLGSKDNVEEASTTMTDSALGSAADIIGVISRAMAESIDLQPTVTPVLDLSNIMAAGSTLDTIFDGYALNLNGVLDRAVAANSSSGPAEVIVQNPTDLTGIQGSIAALQSDIINLQAAISNMKIVLNTGVIAGGVTDDVDTNLGMKSLYASRRN